MKPTVRFPAHSLSCRVDPIMSQQHQGKTADGIVPGMRDHSGPQSSPPQREHAKHRAVRGDEQHSRDSFIAVRATKYQRGEQNTGPDAAPQASKLLLQVTAKDQFFAEAGGDAENQEQHHLHSSDRRQFLGHVTDLLRIDVRSGDFYQCFAEQREHHHRDRPVAERHTDIGQPRPSTGPSFPEKLPQRDPAHGYAPYGQGCQSPLIRDGQSVVGRQMQGLAPKAAQLPYPSHREADDENHHQRGMPPGRQQAARLIGLPAIRLRRFHGRHALRAFRLPASFDGGHLARGAVCLRNVALAIVIRCFGI
jgi:hypothetical protein